MDPPQGKAGWLITISNPADNSIITNLEMENEVLSCSGLQQGQHIINPFTGQPVTDRKACWIRIKSNAALADALTTAGMIMPLEKIQLMQKQTPEMAVMLLISTEDKETELHEIGDWPNSQ
jgi:thiamine biosynthesis lipoprotein ApbE